MYGVFLPLVVRRVSGVPHMSILISLVLAVCIAITAFSHGVDAMQHFSVDESGSFSLSIGRERAEVPLLTRAIGYRSSSSLLTATSELQLHAIYPLVSGKDAVGAFVQQNVEWIDSETSNLFQTNVREYDLGEGQSAFVFQQVFLNGTTGSSAKNSDSVISFFPTFSTGSESYFDGRGWMTFEGNQACSDGVLYCTPVGVFNDKDLLAKTLPSGQTGGVPLLVFNEDLIDTMIVSPFDNFMSTNFHFDRENKVMAHGIQGLVDEVPAGFTMETILYVLHEGGINGAFEGWGNLMQSKYKSTSKHPLKADDVTNNYISYWTDNGAFYYYFTEIGKNYEQTLVDVLNYANQSMIPYKSLQLDSWFYYKGKDSGVLNWTGVADNFPAGLDEFQKKVNIPITAHNRWWSVDTTYAKENGGEYDFIVERHQLKGKHAVATERQLLAGDDLPYGAAIPLEERFWDDLFGTSISWGLYTYEQDWLHNEFMGLNATLTSLTLGRNWLLQMGNAAKKYGLRIQYCMSYPRFFLESLEIENVVQIRASDDYGHGQRKDQWSIGDTSLLAHALNLAPYKDTFWSTRTEPLNEYLGIEPHPGLQAVVSTLSCGPVGISDKIGYSNRTIIMRSCNEDGLILKPSRPLTSIDDMFLSRTFRKSSENVIQATYSVVSGYVWDIILGAVVIAPYPLYPFMLPSAVTVVPDSGAVSKTRYAYQFQDGLFSHLQVFSDDGNPTTIAVCDREDFQLWYVAPEINGFIILGEEGKWVPVSQQRIVSVSLSENKDGSSKLSVALVGVKQESVRIVVAHESNLSALVTVACQIDAEGVATAVVSLSPSADSFETSCE